MLALCQHNGATYYAQNYAGIIGASLIHGRFGGDFNLSVWQEISFKYKSPLIDKLWQLSTWRHCLNVLSEWRRKDLGGGKWLKTMYENFITTTAYKSLRFPCSLIHNNYLPMNVIQIEL